MKKYVIEVQNLKCGGCANSITKRLQGVEKLAELEVDVEKGMVSFQSDQEATAQAVEKELIAMGYPPLGEDNRIGQKAKSYISCMIGKVS